MRRIASDFPGLSGCCAAQASSASVICFGMRNATRGSRPPVAGLPRFFFSVSIDMQEFMV
jgi:hypothetical protein